MGSNPIQIKSTSQGGVFLGMKLNPDLEKRKELLIEIANNRGYCICMIEENEDTKCPCKWKREEDTCVCGLYVKDEE